MRNVPRRSFTVEVKSAVRRNATIIPSRVAAPRPPAPRAQTLPAPSEPAEAARRILPNLIVPETPQAEPEPAAVAEERPAPRPRGRPRKVKPAPIPQAVAEVAEQPAPAVVPQAPARSVEPLQSPRKRKDVVPLELPRGERWKTRRLGRWSR